MDRGTGHSPGWSAPTGSRTNSQQSTPSDEPRGEDTNGSTLPHDHHHAGQAMGTSPSQTSPAASPKDSTDSGDPARVTFSSEAGRPRIAPISTAVASTAAKPGILKNAPVRSPLSPTSPTSPGTGSAFGGSNVVSPRTRNRGYSLRRSLFAQSMQRPTPDNGMIIEMEPSIASTSKEGVSGGSPKSPKRQPTVTISEPDDGMEEEPRGAVRLSDPDLDLPLYQRWLKKQGSRRHRIRDIVKQYQSFRDGLFKPKALPPSADGRHVRVNASKSFLTIDERTHKAYITNTIRSCRYTPLNFFPRQLFAQFGRLANFYFLCVSILQMIPGLSTTGTYTTIIPLLIFVSISMAKEGYDDIRRNRLDKEENERAAYVLDGQATAVNQGQLLKGGEAETGHTSACDWRIEKWKDVRVGDVVLLKRDMPAPADIVLLHSDDPTGATYVETKSLDGESNLKLKKPLQELQDTCHDLDSTASLQAEVVVEDPNLDLYKFDGRVEMYDNILPITNNEVVLRGSILRNTTSAVGIVIYSGEECKIRMNATKNPRVKAPTMQAAVNKVVVFVACLVLFLAIFMTSAYQVWHKNFEEHAWYLNAASVGFGQILVSFIILFNTMLPLSLYVSMEIVKVAQMVLMNDIDMYDEESDTPMEAHTSTINEELGQVSYIFSDKTGTLTNNSMKFRKMSVAGTAWLHDLDLQEEAAVVKDREKLTHKKRGDKGKKTAFRAKKRGPAAGTHLTSVSRPSMSSNDWQPSTRVSESLQTGKTEELLDYVHRRPHSIFARRVRLFILSLALCHTCIPEKDDEGNIDFQAASPDELALVTAAQELGYIVTDRQTNTITVKTYAGIEEDEPLYEEYEVLDVIEFSSARKRMSIIIRLPDGRMCIFCKGADTTIRKLLRLSDLAAQNVDEIQRRSSARKSMEAQEVLRRKSTQLSRKGSLARSSFGTVTGLPSLARNSSVSLGRGRTMRQSIDHFLRDRETDVDMSAPKRSNHFYTPRQSTQIAAPRNSAPFNERPSVQLTDNLVLSPQPAEEDEENDDFIDDSMVLDDNAVFERCFQHIDDFATEGLRTLLYGYRVISEHDYQKWHQIYAEASASLIDRQMRIERAGDLIESQLELVGATAIEDKLQKGVPDAIDRFRRAGIKMWMLTGDKRETAINIGHSCRLIKDYSTIVVLDHELGDLYSKMVQAVADIKSSTTAHSVLVIDGQTLTIVDADQASKALFTDLAVSADSVICCRASPSQKASLVKTIRTKVPGSVTLAIGDGANDIAMIQEAHLGIGIAGKEGLQAARSSDYSIAQFRFLLKLLLVHGRWNYIRVCKYVLGTFWKETLFYLIQALYQRWNGYTGTSLYENWSLSMFNTLFTSLCVIFMGVFEKDLAASTLLAVPELYSIGQKNLGFNIYIYLYWAFLATCEAVILYFTMLTIYGEALFTTDQGLYALGTLCFSAAIIIINLKLQFLELHNKSIACVIALVVTIGGWWVWNLLLSGIYPETTPIYSVNHSLLDTFGKNLLWWVTLLLMIVAVLLFEVAIKSIRTALWPSDVDTFQAYEQELEVRKRFEEAAADLLQQGWDRGTKKSSVELKRETDMQEERERLVQEMLDRPRTMMEEQHVGRKRSTSSERARRELRRRHSGHTEEGEVAVKLDRAEEGPGLGLSQVMAEPEEIVEDKYDHKGKGKDHKSYNGKARRSGEFAEMFSRGFGTVKKGQELK